MDKVIGIDLGGTSIYGGIISERGKILKQTERDTSKVNGREDVLELINSVIYELLTDDILGVGIGSPGFIDSDKGKVLKVGGNIKGWAWTDIRGEISRIFPNLPIFVGNDANVAALCEQWIGAAKGLDSFVMITLGTGVGGAIYTEKGGILTGHRYQGAELGHMILYSGGDSCQCGQKGCAERYIAGSAIERIYSEKTGIEKKGKDIFKDAIDDRVAQDVIEEFTENLGIYLVSLKNIFDPEAIIIGGGVINSREYWWDKMIANYNDYVNDSEGMKFLPAMYLNNAGLIGAGKIVFDNI